MKTTPLLRKIPCETNIMRDHRANSCNIRARNNTDAMKIIKQLLLADMQKSNHYLLADHMDNPSHQRLLKSNLQK